VHVFLETERLVLRRFTTGDVDNLASLDADPDVMRFVSGGIPTSRDDIETEFLPAFLGYYQRYQAFGFWAAIEKSPGISWAGSTSGRGREAPRTRSSSVTGCASQPGATGTPPKGRAR
jgi:RimJ/RimL family protein N-acetyltransferase